MPFEGRMLSISEALALCYTHKFRFGKLIRAVAVMSVESGRWTRAYHDNDNGSTDRGLWQINSLHGHLEEEDFSPNQSTKYAWILSEHGTDFTPWAAFNHKKHRALIPLVTVRYLLRWSWRKLLPTVPDMG